MARAPVKELAVDEAIRPAASPVDTGFRTPALADNGASNLQSLAQGLAKFDKGLNSMLAERQAEQDKADAAQAEVDFHKNNQAGYAKAVEQGLIPAFASKAYVNSWKESEGRNFGNQLQERFNSEYAGWAGKDSEDPRAFDTFLQGFLSQNLPEGTDPAVLGGLRPQLRQMVEAGTNRYIADKDRAIKYKAETATVAEGSASVTDARRKGLETGKVDFDGLYTKLDGIRAKGLSVGMTERDFDPKLMDMVSTEAITAGGADGKKILAYLDRKVPGKDYTFAQTPYGRETKAKTLEALDAKMRKDVAEGRQVQKDKDEKEKRDLTRRAIESLIDNPDKPIDDEVLKRGSTLDGDFRINVMRWQETIRQNKASGNQKALLDLNNAIINGEGMSAVKAALDYGIITSKDELVAAYKLVQEVEKNSPDVAEALKGQQVTELFNSIKGATARKEDLTNPFAPVSRAGLQAQHDLRMGIMKWAQANPEAAKDPIKLQEAVAKIGSLIMGRLSRADGGVGEAQYNRQGFEEVPNPYTQAQPTNPQTGTNLTPFNVVGGGTTPQNAPAPQPQAAELAPPLARGIPSAQAAAQPTSAPRQQANVSQEDANSWYTALPNDSKNVLANAALRANKPFGQYILESYGAGVRAGRIQPVAPQPQAAPTAPPAASPTPQAPSPTGATAQPSGFDVLVDTPAEIGRSISDALRSPGDFMEWLRGGGSQPPANQPSGFDALRNALGDIQSPADFARWLTGGGTNPEADLPAPGAAPAEGPAPESADDNASYPETDATETASAELLREATDAIRTALRNPTFKPKGNYALSTIKDDPLANRLADFVAGPESNGNYNAVWGNANAATDLSKFSVDEILERQRQTVARGGQSATGRYQIIRKTLLGLKKDLGLSGEEKFTPELQDTLFIELAKRRGLEKFRAGKMSEEQFALNLAKEWASLPNPKTGRSYYAGDGLNKAHVTPGQVSVALRGE